MRKFTWAILVCTLIGCGKGGPPVYPVDGRVTFPDGKPLKGGTVEFQPTGEMKGKASARGQIDSDGHYRMSTFAQDDGALEGKHRVLVMSALPPNYDPARPPKPFLHPRFQSYDSSGLEYTVKADGPNEFNITVDPPPP